MNQIKFSYCDFFKVLYVIAVLFLISGCGTYSNKWGCLDARGLPCEMLSAVDEKVDSGEIKEVYKEKCKGRHCAQDVVLPKLPQIKAKSYKAKDEEDVVILEKNFEDAINPTAGT